MPVDDMLIRYAMLFRRDAVTYADFAFSLLDIITYAARCYFICVDAATFSARLSA